MEVEAVRLFYDFFQEFIYLCLLENWPANNTTDIEIKNSFIMARHVETCIEKMQACNILSEFMASLNVDKDYSLYLLKSCFSDPPKYVLSKIISSNCDINRLEVGFRVYIEFFGEDRLEDSLTNIIVEKASIQTLIHNAKDQLSDETILNLRSVIFLSNLSSVENVAKVIDGLCINCDEKIMSLLVYSLLYKNHRYVKIKTQIREALLNMSKDKSDTYKLFWKNLLNFNMNKLIELCLEYDDVFQLITKSFIDCRKLLKENMSATSFYIDLQYSELEYISRNLLENSTLRERFLSSFVNDETELCFWLSVLSP